MLSLLQPRLQTVMSAALAAMIWKLLRHQHMGGKARSKMMRAWGF
jgi:hypothetical protein